MPKQPTKRRKSREPWGRVRKLPSGRYQASYTGPDLQVHKAPGTFDTLLDAREWLTDERKMIGAGVWVAPGHRNQRDAVLTLGEYAEGWLADRDLKPSTRQLYRKHLRNHILPTLATVPLDAITPTAVRRWYADAAETAPTARAHAYALLRTILGSAVDEEIITTNPCHIRGAGNSRRVHKIKPASLPELEALINALPDRYGAMVLIGAWCGARWGEVTELRRSDVDLDGGRISIRRAVTRIGDQDVVGTPKSSAGVRDVAVPPHLIPALQDHLDRWAERGKDGLLFPAPITGGHLQHGTFYKTWDAARKTAGRPDLRFHDLRHTGAVMAAATGATLAELMARLGHSTVGAAMRYQHAAGDRDAEIAALLSKMADGTGPAT